MKRAFSMLLALCLVLSLLPFGTFAASSGYTATAAAGQSTAVTAATAPLSEANCKDAAR